MIDESSEENDFVAELPHKENEIKEQTITLKMIMRRNLTEASSVKKTFENKKDVLQAADNKAEQLLKLTHIHLDRENIAKIDNLAEYLGPVTNLYLQHNLIKKIENLELLNKLTFLTLANNCISRVENLRCLKNLKLLDLSANFIDEFDVGELPYSLIVLDLRGNKCLDGDGNDGESTWVRNRYRDRLCGYLQNLVQLNGEEIEDEDGDEDSGEEDYGVEKLKLDGVDLDDGDSNKHFEVMQNLTQRIIDSSKARQIEYDIESKAELENFRSELERSHASFIEKLNQFK